MDVMTQHGERPAKRARYSRGLKRRPRRRHTKRARNDLPVGRFKVMRWSSASTPNCHVQHVGDDIGFSGTSTTTFALSNVNGFSELVNLFDNFLVHSVQYRWVLNRNPDYATATGNKGFHPRIVWTHDFNDSAPISRDAIYQRANLKEHFFSENSACSSWYSLKPACLIQLYEGPAAAAYGPKWKQWLDTSDNATPHYGIKYSWDNLFTGVTLRLEAKIMFECKGVS